MARVASSPILQMIRRIVDDGKLRQLSDQEVIRQFITQRDQAAFNNLMRRYGPMVLDVCRGVLANESDAEDAFQATFLILTRRAGSIQKTKSIGSWLHGVAYRIALKARQQFAIRHKHERRVEVAKAAAADDLSWREVRQVLHEELNRTSERFRSPLVMCFLLGLTQDEAAVQLGLAKSTLRERLERGRNILRGRLCRRGFGPATVLATAVWPGATVSAVIPSTLASSTLAAATHVVAGKAMVGIVSAKVATLTEGALRAMLLSQIKTVVAVGVVLASLTSAGIILVAHGKEPPPRELTARNPQSPKAKATEKSTPAPDKAKSKENLKRIGQALHKYHDVHNHFPEAAIHRQRDGKPLLSWRVAILPYLGEEALYKEFKLDEPWDSNHNSKLQARMPDMYSPFSNTPQNLRGTAYQVFAGPGTMFDDDAQISLRHVKDGTSNTIMVIEGARLVPWTKPEDITFDPKGEIRKIEVGLLFDDGFHFVAGDGFVHFTKKDFDPKKLRAAITRAGGEIVDINNLNP